MPPENCHTADSLGWFLWSSRDLVDDIFKTHIIKSKEKGEAPVIHVAGISFLFLRHSNVYLVMVTNKNANVMLAMNFLSQVTPWLGRGNVGVRENWTSKFTFLVLCRS